MSTGKIQLRHSSTWDLYLQYRDFELGWLDLVEDFTIVAEVVIGGQ